MKRKILFLSVIAFVILNLNAQQWSPITNNNFWNLNLGRIGIGTNNPQSKLDVKGEVRCTYLTGEVANLRLVTGKYATLLRNDGADTYWLFTNYNNVNGSWNNLRPFRINNSTGDIYLGNNNFFISHSLGRVGIGTNSPKVKLDVNGEIRSKLNGVANLRLVGGKYATLLRSDGIDTYLLLTNYNDVNGSWNNLRPLRVDNATGDVYLGNNNLSILHNSGNVGIGYENPTAKLDVNGTVRAKEVKVCLDQGCDFVFEDNYDLMPLNKLNQFIKKNKHLPNIAPAKEMEKDGIDLSKMNAQLLRKVEELTLYIIEQEKRIKKLEEKIK